MSINLLLHFLEELTLANLRLVIIDQVQVGCVVHFGEVVRLILGLHFAAVVVERGQVEEGARLDRVARDARDVLPARLVGHRVVEIVRVFLAHLLHAFLLWAAKLPELR